MSDDDPKPCPFCGAVPQAYVAFGGPAVICETCDIEMLLTEWNNRSVQPENDALRAEGFAAGWAAAIEAAISACESVMVNRIYFTPRSRQYDDAFKDAVGAISMPTDVASALDRRIREARAHGIREVADSIKSMIVAAGEANLHNRRDGLRDALDAILARADEIEDGRA